MGCGDMSLKDRASENFKKGLNCSQSVIEAYSRASGMDQEMAKSFSAGFGGGMGRAQKTCGAITGAVMAIGCKYHDNEDPSSSKEKVYAKTREFLKKFEKINGSAECYDLLGVDIKTQEGKEKYKKENMFEEKCLKYVQDACDTLEKMI
jgi:C_GCAxxG_C_C family probable redox protein